MKKITYLVFLLMCLNSAFAQLHAKLAGCGPANSTNQYYNCKIHVYNQEIRKQFGKKALDKSHKVAKEACLNAGASSKLGAKLRMLVHLNCRLESKVDFLETYAANSEVEKKDCTEVLSKNFSSDVVHHEVGELEADVAEFINGKEARLAVGQLLESLNCSYKSLGKATCRTLQKGDADSKLCFLSSDSVGAFIVTRDNQDGYHVIFKNRD